MNRKELSYDDIMRYASYGPFEISRYRWRDFSVRKKCFHLVGQGKLRRVYYSDRKILHFVARSERHWKQRVILKI